MTDKPFIAYEVESPGAMSLKIAPRARDWMDATEHGFANRCLPMLMANQYGWIVTNPVEFTVLWQGGITQQDLEIQFPDGSDPRIKSHFGHGILTFNLPYLFRTPPGVNLWVKGPSNHVKDGVHALEGLVETDWTTSTFTMNWKVTRSHTAITFRKEEPICMLVPTNRGLAEQMLPAVVPLESDAKVHAEFQAWNQSRSEFLQRLNQKEPSAVSEGWQRDYFKGQKSCGAKFVRHQTHISLREFQRDSRPHN